MHIDMEAGGCLNAGTSVRAYYDMNDHPMGYRYVKMLEMPRDGPADVSDPPVVGVSQGWIPATVVEDYDPKQNGEAGVLVKLHGFFEDAYREEKPVSGMMWKVQPNLISLRSSPPVKIQLSLLVVRWKEYFTRTTTSRSHNILNEGLIRDVLAGEASCKEVFGKSGAYEVISVFASTGRHLDAVPRELLASSLRGSRKAALFFLWPTLKKGVVEQGHVDAAAMKSLMTGMEGLGVKTCWPHPWSLYEDLVSKQWAPRDCSRLELRIPPTTSVSCKSLREAGVEAVASSAIAELQRLSRERGRTPLSQARCGAALTAGMSTAATLSPKSSSPQLLGRSSIEALRSSHTPGWGLRSSPSLVRRLQGCEVNQRTVSAGLRVVVQAQHCVLRKACSELWRSFLMECLTLLSAWCRSG